MKRRFVRVILATLCMLGIVASSGRAGAQEIQLTGPLKGAPAVRHLRLYREGRLELAPSVSFTLLDEYRRTILIGGRLRYNFMLDWALARRVGRIRRHQHDHRLGRSHRRDLSPRDPLTADNINHNQSPYGGQASFNDQTAKISYVVAPQLTFIPFRGKLAIFNKIFVDTDFYVAGGVGFVGIQERENCGGGGGQLPATTRSRSTSPPRRRSRPPSVGLKFYPGGFWSLGVEYRAPLPFAWNRSGFDERGSGPGNNFPDQKINSDDETFQFNQLVTIALGFYFPFQPKLTE